MICVLYGGEKASKRAFLALKRLACDRAFLLPPAGKSRLYAAVDALNARYGKGKVFSAAQGLGARSWHMKRQKLSRRPTTRWDELMTVR